MKNDDTQRRAFWTERMDEGHAFMLRVMDYPVQECGEKLVSLRTAAADAGVEVVFSDQPHVQGLPRLFLLREGQINGFLHAAMAMNRRDWVLKIEDGYRNRTMQKYVGRTPWVFDAILRKSIWELGGTIPDTAFFFRRVLALTAQMPKIGTHMSGSAIDISVLDRGTGEDIDRGAPYCEMSEKTPMDSPFVGVDARRNRTLITEILEEAGFTAYPYEFWHYSSGDAYERILRNDTTPAQYGAVDWDPESGAVQAIETPEAPLNHLDEIEAEVQISLRRMQAEGAI